MSEKPDNEFMCELFQNYRQMMLKIALGILRNKYDAEDAVQEAFLRVMNNLEKISQMKQKERAFYFVSVIENTSINYLNKKKRHPQEDIDEYYTVVSNYSVEKKADDKFLINEIKSAFTVLSDRDYGILYLYYFEQMTPMEIAKALDMSEKNIYKYIDRAKKRLMKILNERGINYEF